MKKLITFLKLVIFLYFIFFYTPITIGQTVVVNTTLVQSSTFTITGGPKEVIFSISGANGGNGTNTFGGEGATISATYNLNNEDIIRYIVAEGGLGGSEAGGGGSTGIYINNTLVLVAGGGGGGDNSGNAVGLGANSTTNGDNGTIAGTFTNTSLGGINGNGGTSNSASGGGGINSAGGNGSSGSGGGAAKIDFSLALGGTATTGNGSGGRGLTGGGGGGDFYAAGGGGYSGGGAAGGAGSAGGGGSYVNTTYPGYVTSTIIAGANGAATGANETNGTNGSVTITDITDTDDDGILDSIDIDDDNDGILDTNECSSIGIDKRIFTYTGADQTYTIPSNALSITAKIWGAGGRGDERPGRGVGAAGGYTEFTLSKNDLINNTLILTVGQGGNSSTGSPTYGNGGAGSSGTFNNAIRNFGAGGGMSAISYTSLSNPSSVILADLIAIAGGGGSMPAYSNANTHAG